MAIPRNLGNLAPGVDTNGVLGVTKGGTGATSTAAAPFALKGANSDITSLTGLTTALSVGQGGTGATTLTSNNVLLGNGTSALQTVAPGTAGNVLQSNGTTWTSTALASSSDPVGTIQYFQGPTTTTYPGSTWVQCNSSVLSQTTYSALYNKIGLLANNISFSAVTSGTASNILAMTYGNNLFVYAGQDGILRTSTNGVSWASRSSGVTSNINALLYANNLYVYGGDAGNLATSTDAINWELRTSGTGENIFSLAYGNNTYVMACSSGVLRTSTDAITWTTRTPGVSSNDIRALAYGNGIFVLGGQGNIFKTSTDAITWTDATNILSSEIISLTYANGLFIGGSSQSRGPIYSTDGRFWQRATVSFTVTTQTTNTIAYSNGLYIISGQSGTTQGFVAYSYNGIHWTQSPLTTGICRSAAAANGIFLVGKNSGSLDRSVGTTYNTATEFVTPNFPYQNSAIPFIKASE